MANKRIEIKIGGMECPNCAMLLEQIEDMFHGISRVEASYQRGKMVVELDDALVSEGEVSREVQRLGYQVLEIR